MLQVLILEDDQFQREFISELVANRILVNPSPDAYDMQIALATGQASAVLDFLSDHQQDPIFLIADIELTGQELSGIDVAEKVREACSFATIVFVSSYLEYLPLTIARQVEPLDFVFKGIEPEQLKDKLRRGYSSQSSCRTKKLKINLISWPCQSGIPRR